MFATASPVDQAPFHRTPICGASRGLDEVKPDRQRLPPEPDRSAMDELEAGGTRESDFARSRTGPAQDSHSAMRDSESCDDRPRRRSITTAQATAMQRSGPGSDSRQASSDARSGEHKRRDVACYVSRRNRRIPNLACSATSDAPARDELR